MDPRPLKANITAGLSGMLMVLAVSHIFIRSAYLTGPAYIAWIWATCIGLVILMPQDMKPSVRIRDGRLMGTVAVILGLVASLIPVVQAAEGLSLGILVSRAVAAVGQLTAYLSGTLPVIPENLIGVGMHWICGGSALMFLWVRRWEYQSVILAAVLALGCIRWNQYVPDMEAPLIRLALVWCISASMHVAPDQPASSGRYGNLGRFYVSVLLALGVYSGSFALEALFPLDSLNQWIGSRLPVQDLYRNEYTQYGPVGFRLEDTLWYPLRTRLGGAVTLTKDPVMEVRSSRPGLYLRGMVKTTYTGQAWNSDPMALSPFEEGTHFQGRDPFVLTIHPLDPQDRTIYAPLNSDRILSDNRKILMGNESLYRFGFQLFPDRQTSYRVEGYLTGNEVPALISVVPYLQLPAISSDLRKLTMEITGSLGSDLQKMERLQNWLRTNGRYRLDVNSPDPSREFVEQFVLGSREGYCTYFATSLAVMGRVAGIPTRYVEGYLLPAQTTGRQTYLVTSDRAHAWVEAYIQDQGWVVYEPTPVYGLDNSADASASGVTDLQETEKDNGDATVQVIPEVVPLPFSGKLPIIAGGLFMVLLLLFAIRAVWVEHIWRNGVAGSQGQLWQLYSILSVLMLIAPALKGLSLPTEQLKAASSIFTFRAFDSHDIIGDANRLLYGKQPDDSGGFRELLMESWQYFRDRHGTVTYLFARYGSLVLFDSYYPLIRYRKIRKEVYHGADQPHTPAQS